MKSKMIGLFVALMIALMAVGFTYAQWSSFRNSLPPGSARIFFSKSLASCGEGFGSGAGAKYQEMYFVPVESLYQGPNSSVCPSGFVTVSVMSRHLFNTYGT